MNLSAILKSVSSGLRFGATDPSNPVTSKQSPYFGSRSTSNSCASSTTASTISSPSSITDETATPSSLSGSSNTASFRLSPFPSLLVPSEDDEELSRGENRLASAAAHLSKGRHPYQQIIEQILRQVSELEHTLYEDQQQEFKLRMALERQTERVQDLVFSLDTEKQRNGRLVQLLRGIDTGSSGDSEPEERAMSGSHVKSVGDLYDSISPLLMQQRYDELSLSHRQSRRQLAKKDKALKLLKCEKEQLHSKYDQLFDEYRSEQRRFEMICARYIQMQLKKKQQIFNLKNTLGHASECIFHAQVAIDECCQRLGSRSPISQKHLQNFSRNLACFMEALRNCCCLRKVHELQQEQLQHEQKKDTEKDDEKELTPSLASSGTYTPELGKSPIRRSHRIHCRKRHSHR